MSSVCPYIFNVFLLVFLFSYSSLLTVATGFPSGQYALKSRLEEIEMAVANGAKEIDIVINREMALTGNWKGEEFLLKTVFLSLKISYLIILMCMF